MKPRMPAQAGLRFLANPYVVLVDLLIATFLVMVLYIHTARVHVLATTDPRIAKIQQFAKSLHEELIHTWGNKLQDEGRSGETTNPAFRHRDKLWLEQRWWQSLPPQTSVILKQDASSIKLILFGATEERALFRRGTSRLTSHGNDVIAALASSLAKSDSARELAANKAILSITVEGHAGAEEFKSPVDAWRVSLERALEVQQKLETWGKRSLARKSSAQRNMLFNSGRFSVVGRANYLNLPFSNPLSPMNRRVQIEIRFTSRFDEPPSPAASGP